MSNVQSATLEMIKRAVQEPDKGATKIRNDFLNDLRKNYKDSPKFLGEIIQEFKNLEYLDEKGQEQIRKENSPIIEIILIQASTIENMRAKM